MNARKLLLIVGLIVAGFVLMGIFRWQQRSAAFNKAVLGQPRRIVLAGLGKPWRIAPCGETFGGTVPPHCSQEIIFASPFSLLAPEYLSFFFDKNDSLISTYRYVSP
jgi:hypothetical protein